MRIRGLGLEQGDVEGIRIYVLKVVSSEDGVYRNKPYETLRVEKKSNKDSFHTCTEIPSRS
jgi:hypothetical protein